MTLRQLASKTLWFVRSRLGRQRTLKMRVDFLERCLGMPAFGLDRREFATINGSMMSLVDMRLGQIEARLMSYLEGPYFSRVNSRRAIAASSSDEPTASVSQTVPDSDSINNYVTLSLNTALRDLNAIDTRTQATLSLADADFKASTELLNRVNALENQVLLILNGLQALQAAPTIDPCMELLQRAQMNLISQTRFPEAVSAVPDAMPTDLNQQLAQLKTLAPLNFAAWQERFETGRLEYDKRLPSSLSTSDHRGAFFFRAFIAAHARGRCLDIGVGPLAKPSYLDDLPDSQIAGIDPLPAFEPHPFTFATSLAEFLPWPDNSFETILIGTSLDHIYLLDKSFEEMKRVLTPGGRILIWTGIFADTPPYDPYRIAIDPPDAFHLFHPGENWFPKLLETHFRLRERFNHAAANAFFALEKKD